MKKLFLLLLTFCILNSSFFIPTAKAVYDPLSVPNNKYGIHLISASVDEASAASDFANSNGDWGYITVLAESKDRDEGKWQTFFNDLRRRHLIPLVRLATSPDGNFWKTPYDGEEQAWADFLDKLVWPTKNRYVIIYNEPNHATEWQNQVDAKHYAKVLNKTIDALKKKNPDFFVLNAGLDASAPQKLPAYQDEANFLSDMNEEVPGIFNKLDGWVSHSYPNPNFSGSPNSSGKGTVRTYLWELNELKKYGLNKDLPVFIAETGWKHSEGMQKDRSLSSPETLSSYYKNAFENAWNHPKIVAVTPFVLNYQHPPFDHFSFKKYVPQGTSTQRTLGIEYPEFHPFYKTLADLPKTQGQPIQENKATLTKGEIFKTLISDESYNISLTFKNTGQSIWNESPKNDSQKSEQIKLAALEGGKELGLTEPLYIPFNKKVEPNQDHTINFRIKAPKSGSFNVSLNLYKGDKPFDNPPFVFKTEVKSPVVLKVKASLNWKNDPSGNYILNIAGAVGQTLTSIVLGKAGVSEEVEARYLLPDYTFSFTLEKPFYRSKTISQNLHSGVNELDFGALEPDVPSAILHPTELWKLLPFSN